MSYMCIYLHICNAVQKLLHPAVVDVVGPVDEVLVDVDLGQAAVGELLPLLKDATWREVIHLAGPVDLVHSLVQAHFHFVEVRGIQLPGSAIYLKDVKTKMKHLRSGTREVIVKV